MDNKTKNALLWMIIILLVLLNILAVSNQIKKIKELGQTNEVEEAANVIENTTAETEAEQRIKSKSENERVRIYVARFLEKITDEDYKGAYDLLNEEFKSTNFSTIDGFIEFVKKAYPSEDVICSYANFEIIGTSVYVITVTIKTMSQEDYQPIVQTFVVRENAYNDYKISFQLDYSNYVAETEEEEEE